MPNAHHIIELFGGTRPMARVMDLPPTTVQAWKRSGYIPARKQADVLDAAEREGIPLTPADLIANHPTDEAQSDERGAA
jgi:hypothetical protein